MFEQFSGSDPLGFVSRENLDRRHLTESQRAMIAARIANMRRGRPGSNAANLPVSQSRAAALLNVSERTVRDAARVQRDALPEISTAVDAGQIAVSAAAVLAEAPADVQRSVWDEAQELAGAHGHAWGRRLTVVRELIRQRRARECVGPPGTSYGHLRV